VTPSRGSRRRRPARAARRRTRGRARTGARAVLAETLGVPRAPVAWWSGERSRRKRVRIAGLTAAAAARRPFRYTHALTSHAGRRPPGPGTSDRGHCDRRPNHPRSRPNRSSRRGSRAASRQRPAEAGAVADGRWRRSTARSSFAGTTADCDRLVAPAPALARSTPRPHDRPRLRRRPHARGVRRRPPRGAAPPAGGARPTRRSRPRGGGILSTVRATREAPDDAAGRPRLVRLDEMLRRCGTTTGSEERYGGGLRWTRSSRCWCLRRLGASTPWSSSHLHGAPRVPPEYRERRREYVDLVTGAMIPAVAREGWPSGATSSARPVSTRLRSRRRSCAPAEGG